MTAGRRERPAATATPGPIVVMARVIAAYGVHGWIKLRPFTENTGALLDYRPWWLRLGGESWREVLPLEGREHAGSMVAKLAAIDDREAAQRLAGAEIGVPRAALPVLAEDALYCSDLVGLAVVNREGVELGEVVAVEDYGAHPVLKVVGATGGEARLIPWVAAHVDAIDMPARRITVDWQPEY